MAKRKKGRKRSSTGRSRSRKGTRKGTRKRGLMGIPASGGSTGQKLGRAGLILASGLAGAAAGSYAGKWSGGVGVASVLTGALVDTKYSPYLYAVGAGMIAAPTKMLSGQTEEQAVAGLAGFNEDGQSRLKNFAGMLSEKFFVEQPVKKALGISGIGNVSYNPDMVDYSTMLPESTADSDAVLYGTTNPLLAGMSDESLAY